MTVEWILRHVDPENRVYSGVSAILDFQIVNFRPYACLELHNSNCRIFELFLTVDTSRKMQNGITIDDSIDRFDNRFFIDLAAIKHCNFSGIDILRNDIDAVLGQIFNTTYNENQRHSKMRPGKDQLTMI